MTIATGKEVALLLFHTPTKYGSDRFRQIFIDHWAQWWDYRQKEIPADQRAYVQKWVGHIAQELLDVSHLHLTLTIAKELEPPASWI